MGRNALVRVGGKLLQGSAQNIKAILSFAFRRPTIKAPFELIPNTVQWLGGKAHLMPLDKCPGEKLVEKNSAIAIGVAQPGDVAGCDMPIQVDLQEFPFLEECIHPGDIFRRCAGAILLSRLVLSSG